MTTGWRGNPTLTDMTYSTDGVSFNARAKDIGAAFDVKAPVQLENAVIEMVVNVSSEFKASGAHLQPFAQLKTGKWPGEWDCWASNVDLTAATDTTIRCTIDDAADIFNTSDVDVQIGVQAEGDAPITPTGIVTIKSVKITLATAGSPASSAASETSSAASTETSSADSGEASSAASSEAPSESSSSSSSSSVASGGINADMTNGWEVGNGGGKIAYTANGVVYTPAAPTQYDSGVYFLPVGPFNLEGATLSVTIIPDAAFIASGKNPQPWAQVAGGTYAGEYNCWFNNADLVVNASNVLTCKISEAGNFNITDTTPVRLGFQVVGGAGTTFAGSVTITAASVVLAE